MSLAFLLIDPLEHLGNVYIAFIGDDAFRVVIQFLLCSFDVLLDMRFDFFSQIQAFKNLFITLKHLDSIPALLLLRQVMHRNLFNVSQCVFYRTGEAMLRDSLAVLRSFNSCQCCFLDTIPLKGRDFHNLAAQLSAQFFDIDAVSGFSDQIHHVQRNDNRDAKLGQLRSQIQISLQVCGIYNIENSIWLFLYEIVTCHNFFQGIRRKGIDAGQVSQDDFLVDDQLAFFFFYCHAWPVSDELRRACQLVEQGCFAAVRVACKSNANLFIHGFLLLLFDFDHFRVSLADRQFIVSHIYLDGVSQRGKFTYIYFNALGDAHVHNAAFNGSLTVQLNNFDGLADFNVSECFHVFCSFIFILIKP